MGSHGCYDFRSPFLDFQGFQAKHLAISKVRTPKHRLSKPVWYRGRSKDLQCGLNRAVSKIPQGKFGGNILSILNDLIKSTIQLIGSSFSF